MIRFIVMMSVWLAAALLAFGFLSVNPAFSTACVIVAIIVACFAFPASRKVMNDRADREP